jgi:heme A synthase
MKAFRLVAITTALGVYGQIVLGGVVRISGSGLGCRDWPLCYQHETDRFAYRTLIEVAHRLFGTATGIAVVALLALAVWLYRRRRVGGDVVLTVAVLLGMYGVQALLGGLTVLTGNQPWTVALHLGNSLLVLALALTVALWAGRLASTRPLSPPRASLPVVRLVVASAVMTYAVVITGAFVVGTGASGACSSWPLCGSIHTSRADVHMLHRVIVLLSGVLLVFTVRQAQRHWRGRAMGAVAWLAAAAYGVEVAVGAAQVLLSLPAALRGIHLAMATAAWAGIALLGASLWLDRLAARTEAIPSRGLAGLGATS